MVKRKRKVRGKIWYKSKRLWVSALAIMSSVLQWKFGLVMDGPTQGLILGIIYMIVGIDTKVPIAWSQASDVEYIDYDDEEE